MILPVPLAQSFTYHVPDRFQKEVQVGCRVVVQFGNRKFYTGICKSIHQSAPEYETKPLEVVLDNQPVINEWMFRLWEWMADYYLCSTGEVMKAALPAGLKLESQSQIILNENWLESEKLSSTEEAVYQFLYNNKHASIQQVNSLTSRSNAYPLIKSLLNKGAIIVEEKLRLGYQPKTVSHVGISETLSDDKAMEEAFAQLKRAQKQLDLLMFLLSELNYYAPKRKSSVSKKELLKKSGSNEGVLKALVKRNFVTISEVETDRLSSAVPSREAYQLNPYQQKAINEIYAQFREKDVVLLHGVTSSGKTEMYIQMIAEQLKAGKQVLYLLPEIALTAQIIERLSKVFGQVAGIYHSKFSDAERVEIWNKVLEFDRSGSSRYQLIVGARSSIFLPFKKLGLVIVDEEHETSFKQFDPAPRYNARDTAVVLAQMHGAKLLMGTATPSFESYFNSKTGKYGYVQLKQRHNDVQLPEIEVADMRDAYKRKLMKSHFTPQLFDEMTRALENNKQIILFQNRRGFSPFIQCRTCGFIPKCKHCDVSLSYHKFINRLQCHYCGYTSALPAQCPECHSADMQTKGFGTEKIEDELKIFFPEIKVSRLDLDATRKKQGFEKAINDFAMQKTQILVGTQMITKGLDFEHVHVVGILNADNLLNFPDFRSYEKAFQLMLQVSGRAGRKAEQGKVIIQTSQAEHKVIELVQKHDFETFFNLYIQERKMFHYPPWFRLIYLTIKHKNRDRANRAAHQVAELLRKKLGNQLLGPEYHLISRVQQYYQLMIRIKLNKNQSPAIVKKYIVEAVEKVKHYENNSQVQVNIDVDPY